MSSFSSSQRSKVRGIKGIDSLYRYAGIIGCIATFVQSCMWSILCFVGIVYLIAGGKVTKKRTFLAAYTRSLAKLYFQINSKNNPSSITAYGVIVILLIYLILSVILLVTSVYLFRVFRQWRRNRFIRKASKYWTLSAIAMGLFELMTFILFLGDYLHIKSKHYEGNYTAASLTMMVIAIKGGFMWGFNLSLAMTLFYLNSFKKKAGPGRRSISDPGSISGRGSI